MCGIVAYVGRQDAVPVLVEGLRRLEYRGYDSAGIAVVTTRGLAVHKSAGVVEDLVAGLPKRFKGSPGIAHTRWATHGEPSDVNAHPHTDAAGRIAIVHNGIIENAAQLRAKLEADGITLTSATDSEVLAHLIAAQAGQGLALTDAVRAALTQVVGTYGLAVIDAGEPDLVVVARHGSPLVLGLGDRELFAASDVSAFVRHTRQVIHLDDGDVATLRPGGYRITALGPGATGVREPQEVRLEDADHDVDGHPHFMHKEIHEQPQTVARALLGRLDERFATAHLGGLGLDARTSREIARVHFLGCGSAYYAGEAGAQLVESLARIPARAEPASEFRYRNPVVEPDTLYVAVSQSGETADTIAAVQELQRKGGRVIGIVNVVGSTLARECGGGMYLHAGPEVSVTSTKAYTAMYVASALLALHLGRVRDLSHAQGRSLVEGLQALPGQIEQVLAAEDRIAALAGHYAQFRDLMFVGRVRGWPVAREGAQKLKEVSYLHAEAYPAAELKHGPLALVGPELPTVAVVPDDELLDKNVSTLQEIRARRGGVLAVAHRQLPPEVADHTLVVPKSQPELDPILLGIPLQLLAYHAAVSLGRDVDRPRNLAKSVTVE
ncbi:MAG TPA: glutamine--fructose-6-phosphate transaminase (isomerizing) [Kineosporiaceae bacterium]|nr:glutamine--fructose-6-phosphate transaminase (isomerizing) [Kineosporiaceae bacterium]